MARSSVGDLLLAATAVAACVGLSCAHQRVRPPALERVALGSLSLEARDYAAVDACQVETAPLAQETEALNTFFGRYLDMTSAADDGHWSEDQLRVLESSPNVVPRLARSEQKVFSDLTRCEPPEALGFAELRHQGSELSRQALLRAQEAPELSRKIRARHAVEAWKQTEARERATARESQCPRHVRAGKVPPIYYAAEDELGQQDWLFCDGVRVTQEKGASAAKVVSLPDRSVHQAKDAAYLSAAAAFPADQLKHAPKLPGAPAAPAEEPPEKDPEI